MACIIDSGFALGCRDNLGGVKKVYISTFQPDAVYTYNTDGEILTALDVNTFHEFAQEIEVATFNQTANISIENGTIFYTQELSLTFHKNETRTRNLLLMLAKANMSVIVEDQNSQNWLIGKENGVRAINATSNLGKSYGDLNGVTITLQAKEKTTADYITDLTQFIP
jgi:hypothetical protein